MAAAPESLIPELVDLRRVERSALDALLEEETAAWKRDLDWDFRQSADVVRRFVNLQALNGQALVVRGGAVGYAYYVVEERKGLIGDLYLLDRFVSVENENRLLGGVLDSIRGMGGIGRVETQLLLQTESRKGPFPYQSRLHVHERLFMTAVIGARQLRPIIHDDLVFTGWSEGAQEEVAALIAVSYRGHVDADINDQYRSLSGARRFLFNIIQYPGCGTFLPEASWLAREAGSGKLHGVSLVSTVASDVGHITQICVAPGCQGRGLGHELMRRSLESLAFRGCRKASLTVTAANGHAVQLYERMGFRIIRRFHALVWDDL